MPLSFKCTTVATLSILRHKSCFKGSRYVAQKNKGKGWSTPDQTSQRTGENLKFEASQDYIARSFRREKKEGWTGRKVIEFKHTHTQNHFKVKN